MKNNFLNIFFLQTAVEMGKNENEAAEFLCLSENDIFKTIELLELGNHEYIEYYIEELTKEVFFINFS